MKKLFTVAFALLAVLSACGHGTIPRAGAPGETSTIGSASNTMSIVRSGYFTEYTMPSGVAIYGARLANDSAYDHSVWFAACASSSTNDIPAKVYRLSATYGTLTAFSAPSTYTADTIGPSCNFAYAGGYFWYPLDDLSAGYQVIARVTPSGAFGSFTVIGGDLVTSNLAMGSDGKIWFSFGAWRRCTQYPYTAFFAGRFANVSTSGVLGVNAAFPATWQCNPPTIWFHPSIIGHAVASGPDNNLYFAGQDQATGHAMVVKVSTSGTILATFNLPANSFPVAIVTGPDRNLWIAENGARKIARMTAAGAVTQFALPTTASVADITAVPATGVLADGALWFTDGSSKIGRITTSGAITEYSTPTAGSDPRHIIPCPISICGVYGGVWFTEDGLNRVARFDFSH